MNEKLIALAALSAAFAVAPVCDCLAEEAPAEAAAEETPVPEKPKKKLKKVLTPYANWDLVSKVAESQEQPIVVFIGLQGDKESTRVRNATVFNPAFKDFLAPNALLYVYNVPELKEKKNNQRGNQKKDKNAKPKADTKSIKESEKIIVGRLTAGSGHGADAYLPVIAVVTPGGKVVGTQILVDAEDPFPFGKFIEDLKSAFEAGKYACEINKKVQKEIDAQAKKIADLEKRKKK